MSANVQCWGYTCTAIRVMDSVSCMARRTIGVRTTNARQLRIRRVTGAGKVIPRRLPDQTPPHSTWCAMHAGCPCGSSARNIGSEERQRLASVVGTANVANDFVHGCQETPPMSAMPENPSPSISERPRLLSLPNGEKATPTFSREEMDRRLSTLRVWMQEASLDACVFTSIHNVNYFADYVYCSFGRHYALVVTPDAHTIIGANLDYGRPWRRSFAHCIAYTDWQRDNFFVAVRSLCPARGRIGVELDHLTCAVREKLQAADSGRGSRRCCGSDDAHAHDQVRRGAGADPRRRGNRGHWRGRGSRSHCRRRARTRGGAARDPGDGARDCAPLPARRAAGHLDVVSVRHQHRRRPQPGDHAPGCPRRHPEPQLLPDDRRVLPRAGAHPVLRPRPGRGARAVGGELRGAPPWHRADWSRRALHGYRARAE